jgi:hypothetical protein
MQGAEALLIHAAENVRANRLGAVAFDLEQGVHVHVVEDDQLIAPVAIRVHVAVQVDGLAQASHHKGGEGKRLARRLFVPADRLPRQGDVELHQPVHRVPPPPHLAAVDHGQADAGKGLHGVTVVVFVHDGQSPVPGLGAPK